MKKAILGILMALLFLGLSASPLSGRAFAQQPQDDGSDEESAAAADQDADSDEDAAPGSDESASKFDPQQTDQAETNDASEETTSPEAGANQSAPSNGADEPVVQTGAPAAETDNSPAPKGTNPSASPGVSAMDANGQRDKYVAAMQKNIALLDSAKTVQDLQSVALAFERIGDEERTQWLPYYYSGLALSTLGWMDQKLDKDANSGRINALCDKAEAIEKNAEIYALRYMSATQQMLVDPQTRSRNYGRQATDYLQEGLKLDPVNPRLYYLQGQSTFGTPEPFGGGKKKAKPLFEKAVALYKTYQVKPLYPHWGQKSSEDMLAKCQ